MSATLAENLLWTTPVYRCLFPIDEAFEFGQETFARINETITGTMACFKEDAGLYAQAIANAGDGDHLELGTLAGGGAILAALTKQKYGLKGKVICVDKCEPFGGLNVSPELILSNAAKMGVADYIEVIPSMTYPLPTGKRHFETVYVDAGHDYQHALQDWNSVRPIKPRYALFHDCDAEHVDVLRVVRNAAKIWPLVFLGWHTAILEQP